jgi:hypothetical protein
MNDPARTHRIFENFEGMRHRVRERSGFSTFARRAGPAAVVNGRSFERKRGQRERRG